MLSAAIAATVGHNLLMVSATWFWKIDAGGAQLAGLLLPVYQAQLQSGQLFKIVNFDGYAARLLKTAIEHSRLFARTYHKIQRVARTVADRNAEATISWTTISEALAYRAMPLLA